MDALESEIRRNVFLELIAELYEHNLSDVISVKKSGWRRSSKSQRKTNGTQRHRNPTPKEPEPVVDPNERPYSINDLAVLHNLSYRTIVRLYENEPGVQILKGSQDHEQVLGRRYRTIRVPRHVYMRVKHRLENT